MKTHILRHSILILLALVLAVPAVAGTSSTTGLSGSLESSRSTHFYKDPTKALLLSVFPGFLIHGYGHLYAKDKMVGTALLGGEVLSLVSIGMGAMMKSDPQGFTGGIFGGDGSTVENTGQKMIIYGSIGFAITWFADILHAPTAAKDYNDRWNLQPVASAPNGIPTLAFAVRF